MYYNDHEVTLGEVLASIVIVLVLVLFGVLISNKITSSIEKGNEKYEGVIQLSENETELFEYSMQTNVGNALVNGKFESETSISLDELQMEYAYIKKIKERYTQKTKVETYEDEDGNTHTKTVTYEEWDTVGSEEYYCDKLVFMGVEFDTKKFDISSYTERLSLDSDTISYKYQGRERSNYLYERGNGIFYNIGDIRYSYRVIPIEFSGTIFAKLSNNDISPVESQKIKVHNKSIEDFLEDIANEAKGANIAFWIFWVIGIGILVFVFVMNRNKWADIIFHKSNK